MGAGVPITGCCGEAQRMPSDRRTGPRADVPSAETCKRPPGSTKPRSRSHRGPDSCAESDAGAEAEGVAGTDISFINQAPSPTPSPPPGIPPGPSNHHSKRCDGQLLSFVISETG